MTEANTEQTNEQETAPDELIEINDPELEPQMLMSKIRERIRRQQQELEQQERPMPQYGEAAAYPEPPADLPYDPDLYHHLRRANQLFRRPDTEEVLLDSPATRVPLLGSLWRLVRRQAHDLILFYINRSAAHQRDVDYHLVSTINRLVNENIALQRRVADLEAQLTEVETNSSQEQAG